MGYIYKLKPEIINFIKIRKRKIPEISCRKLSQEILQKFKISISKSLVNNLLKEEQLSSPVGRRSKHLICFDKELDHGCFFFLLGVDSLLKLSKIAANALMETLATSNSLNFKDIQNAIQGLMIFRSIYDTTLDLSDCYNNNEIWALVGYRPSRTIYKRIVEMLNNSQLFGEQLVRELKGNLKLVSGFRFTLSDGSSFFIDAQFKSIWQSPPINKILYTTYYIANSYINLFSDEKGILSIFNAQGSGILVPETLDFILSFISENNMKKLTHIEILDFENNVLEKKVIFGSQMKYFLLGFWPWQLDIMYQYERKPAKNRLVWPQLGVTYFYQIEEVLLPQPLVTEKLKLRAIIIKSTPLGSAKIAILTNIPEEILHNYLSLEELYHWILPEEKYKLFSDKSKINLRNLSFFPLENLDDKSIDEHSLEGILGRVNRIIFQYFRYGFLPEECQNWNLLKIKDVFLRQKAKIERGRELIVHNSNITNELCKEEYLKYICQQFNSLGIKNEQGKLLWFKFSKG